MLKWRSMCHHSRAPFTTDEKAAWARQHQVLAPYGEPGPGLDVLDVAGCKQVHGIAILVYPYVVDRRS